MSTERAWSNLQQDIFSWFKTGKGNLIVRARAGTGKTTTIIEAINHAPERKILLAAFNKRIASELKDRLKNQSAEAKTLHSVGVSFLYRNWEGAQLDEDRGERLAKRALPAGAPGPVINLVKRLAALAKGAAPKASVGDLVDMAYSFDIDADDALEEQGWTTLKIAECAARAMGLAIENDGTFDFDDMIYVPVALNWVTPRFDLVVIDEAQDMNAAQLTLAKKGGRIVVVGDDMQAIYAFRGADSNSLDRLKTELKAIEKSLTITYRCPKSVVRLANTIVLDFEAGPTQPEGSVTDASLEQMIEKASAGDFVLSRKNAPLAKVCLSFIRKGRKAMIEGRDVGASLLAIIKKINARDIPMFLQRLSSWEKKQLARVQKAVKSERASKNKLAFIADQAETLRAFAETSKSVTEMTSKISDMFQETVGGKKDYIVCSSVHKAKGQERQRVWGLVDTLMNGRGDPEEDNIAYVMYSRAQMHFVKVTGIG